MANKIFIRGASIDGAVYWAGDGSWSSSVVGAFEMRTELAALAALAFLQEQLAPASLDDVIGRREMVAHSAEYVEAQYRRAMAEDAEEEE